MRSSKRNAQPSTKLSVKQVLNSTVSSSEDIAIRSAEKLFISIDSATSLGLFLCIKYSDFNSLISHSVNPKDYIDWEAYALDNQACKYLSKYPNFDLGRDLKADTLKVFLHGEGECATTNQFFKKFQSGAISVPVDCENVLYDARTLIEEILGDFSIDEWLDHSRFGPGVSSHFPHGKSDYVKLSRIPSVTKEFELHARALLMEFPSWVRSLNNGSLRPIELKTVPGGSYAQVPKNAKINRNIETQPLLNGFAQLGLGHMIRVRLKKYGIDLNDQSRNRELARRGSLYGKLCTLDLSNASDTISKELVRWIIPSRWFHAMDICRTRRIEIEGSIHELERFSSMGNGFTFELESLIFFALAYSSSRKSSARPIVSVYGDDIIVPAKALDLTCKILHTAGFTVNLQKSFSEGLFRESCGADWFFGRQVRPFYLKEDPTNVASLISMANGLKRVAYRFNSYNGYHRKFASAWYVIYRRIPVKIRSRLAHASDADDTFILSGKLRDGFRIIRQVSTSEATGWYTSIATALYRCHHRNISSSDPTWYREREVNLIRGMRQKISHIPYPERLKATLSLERHRHDSFYRWHRDAWW